jgi:hypothetical protein
MKRFILLSLFSAVVGVLLCPKPAAADQIWWSDNNGNTGTLSTSTLSVTNLFSTLSGGSTFSMQDIAFGPSNVLYGVDGNNQLYSINTSNGAATMVGSPNSIGRVIFGMGYSNGSVYAGAGNQLYSVNLGAGTYMALPNPIGLPGGAIVAGDVQVGADGVTYLTDTDGDLVSVNLSTGVGTVVGTNSFYASDQILGLALGSSGTLWGLTEDGELLTINPALGNGFVQAVDGTIDYPNGGPIFFFGATAANLATPEPATMTLLGIGTAGLLGYRRWRRKPARA